MRDAAALESALARPKNLYAYSKSASLAELAASYGFGSIRSHPFTDGNKRAGLLAMGLFLAINGCALYSEQVELIQVIMEVAAGRMKEGELAAWVRAHMKRIKRSS